MLEKYLKDIGSEKKDLQTLTHEERCTYLCSIYFGHITHFPYHNFELRKISQQHPVHRQSLNLFDYRNLLSTQTGGYCYQSNRLMYHMLKELGFTVDCCSARVLNGRAVNAPEVLELPATHSILIVSIDDQKSYLDPGLGSNSPRAPILIGSEENEIEQAHGRFKLSLVGGLYVYEKFKDNAWYRVSQAEMQCIEEDKLAYTLLQLERFPKKLPIRDEVVVAGMITKTGSKTLLWKSESEKFMFSVDNNGEISTQEIATIIEAMVKLLTEFNITHISADELKSYCQNQQIPLKPLRSCSVDFPIDQCEVRKFSTNLGF